MDEELKKKVSEEILQNGQYIFFHNSIFPKGIEKTYL